MIVGSSTPPRRRGFGWAESGLMLALKSKLT